jgi:DNA-3-methyladenine glycosylase I
VAYHDSEWGVPVHGDHTLFELLTLEGAQAGLSWLTVLRRREGYRRVFAQFDPLVVAKFSDKKVERILLDPGIVRHRQKVNSVVTNARAIVKLANAEENLDSLLWRLGRESGDIAKDAKAMSTHLGLLGFKFVGPTICMSLIQASGMVNAHARECFRYSQLENASATDSPSSSPRNP